MSNVGRMLSACVCLVVLVTPCLAGPANSMPGFMATVSSCSVETYPGKVAAMGDSLTDEYEVAEGAVRSFARNWLELLHDHRGLDLGVFTTTSRGTPRNQGYENNWARAGATTETMLSEGQHTGVAAQLAGGQIDLVFLMIGNNDFAFNYDWIYNGGTWTTFVDNAANRVQIAVNTVLDADPNVKLVLATVPDWELDPWYRQNYPVALKRQNVINAMARYNERIRQIAASSPRIALADVHQLSLNLLALPRIVIGGCEIKNNTWSDNPTTLIMGDHIHPGTVASGLIANEFIKAMNEFDADISIFNDNELLANAGLLRLQATVGGGAGTVSPQTGAYIVDEVVMLTAVPADGYRVKRWMGTDDDSSTDNTNFVTMDADKSVTVEFEQIPTTKYTLTASVVGGHGSVSPTDGAFSAGMKISLQAVPEVGYQVKRWTGTDKDGSTASTNLVTMNTDKYVTVEFELMPPPVYTLSAGVASGQGDISPDGGTYAVGSKITLTAVPADGYCLRRWTGTDDDTSLSCTNTVTMNANRKVTVEFGHLQYQLATRIVGTHGILIVAPINQTYNSGTKVTLTACPEDQYFVARWTGTDDDASTANTNSVTMTADRSVVVEFQHKPFNLTTQVIGGHGSLLPGDGSYSPGTVVSLTATPDPGYRVKRWTGTDNDGSLDPANSVTVSADRKVTVEFEKITFQLSAQVVGGNGTVNPTSGAYEAGTKVTLSATPASRNRVKKWTGTDDDTSTSPANTVTITTDTNVTVEFELAAVPLYQLTTQVSGGVGTIGPEGGRYPAGTVVQLLAVPGSGYRVKSWKGTDNNDCTSCQNTVVMDSNKTVVLELAMGTTPSSDGENTQTTETPYPMPSEVTRNCGSAGMFLIVLVFLGGIGLGTARVKE